MRAFATVIVVLSLLDCADTHRLVRTNAGQKSASLDRRASAYVAVPRDGRYGTTLYTGSGATTAQVVAAAFATYLQRITTGLRVEEFDEAMQSARAGGFNYLLYPQILHWEDRKTEWSGKPDRVSVKVSVIGVETGEVLEPMAEYAASLFD